MLRSLENRVPRKVCGPERQELRGKCRELRNEVLNNGIPHQILFRY